jgi:hypothetical protein
MRPDGFSGMATLVTSDAILGKSTTDIVHEFLAQTGLGAESETAAAESAPIAPARE